MTDNADLKWEQWKYAWKKCIVLFGITLVWTLLSAMTFWPTFDCYTGNIDLSQFEGTDIDPEDFCNNTKTTGPLYLIGMLVLLIFLWRSWEKAKKNFMENKR